MDHHSRRASISLHCALLFIAGFFFAAERFSLLEQKYLEAAMNFSDDMLEKPLQYVHPGTEGDVMNFSDDMLETPLKYIHPGTEGDVMTASTELQENIVRTAIEVSRNIPPNTRRRYTTDAVDVLIMKQRASYYKGKESRLYEHQFFEGTSIQLPENLLSNDRTSRDTEEEVLKEAKGSELSLENEHDMTQVIFNSYRNLHCQINSIPCIPPPNEKKKKHAIRGEGFSRQINSGIIGATIGSGGRTWHTKSNEFVFVEFNHIYDGFNHKLDNVKCVWWNRNINDWSSDGCELNFTSELTTICRCTHLTNFAVIMDIGGVLDPDSMFYKVLQVLTIIGCTLSLIFLVPGFFWFRFVSISRTDDHSECLRYNSLKHQCICLSSINFILLVGLDRTGNEIVCGLVAGVLQIFIIASLMISIATGGALLGLLSSRGKRYFDGDDIVGLNNLLFIYMIYGLPATIIVYEMSIMEGVYGTDDACWLATGDAREIFTFSNTSAMFTSVIMVIMLFTALLTVGYASGLWRSPLMFKTPKYILFLEWFSSSGIVWLSGFLYQWEETKYLSVIFTVLLSFQGVAIVTFGAILNKDMQNRIFNINYMAQNIGIPFVRWMALEVLKRIGIYMDSPDDI